MKKILLIALLFISTLSFGQTIRLSQIEPIQGTVIKSTGEIANKILTTNGSGGASWQAQLSIADYIQNQNAAAQTANMWISGNVIANYFKGTATTLNIDPSIVKGRLVLNETIDIIGTNFSGTARMQPFVDGSIDLGSSGNRFNMLYLSGINIDDKGFIYKSGSRFIHNFAFIGGVNPFGKNTFVGIDAGNFTMGSTASNQSHSSNNSGFGNSSLAANTLGYNNSAVGSESLTANTTGKDNAAVGYQSLAANTTGHSNSAVGYQSLAANTTGSNNSAVGYQSLLANTTGIFNSAVGQNALYANTTGGYHSAFGMYALAANTTGSKNTAIGYSAGRLITSGSNQTGTNNTFLGADTKSLSDGRTNETVIGYNAIGKGSNTITLGNTSVTEVHTNGKITHAAAVLTTQSATLGQVQSAVSGSTNYVSKFTGINTIGNSQIYDNGTNVGIGTSAPDKKLEVFSQAGVESALRIRQSGYNYWDLKSPASTTRFTIGDVNGDYFTILNLGNVGIGTIAPTEKLEVSGKTKTTTLQVTTDAFDGYFMKTDASGNGTWSDLSAIYEPKFAAGTAFQYLKGNKTWGDLQTGNVPESFPNQYFTDARARAAISLTTLSTSGAATYTPATGVFNIPNYTKTINGLPQMEGNLIVDADWFPIHDTSTGIESKVLMSGLKTYLGTAGMTDPMTTRGDIIYRNSSNVTARLPLGASGQILTSNGLDLYYSTPTPPPLYSLPLAANGTRGGLQIGYVSSDNDFALKLSSEKGYVSLPDASTTTRGIASFATSNFTTSYGYVTIKDAGITANNLTNGTVGYAKLATYNAATDGASLTYSSGVNSLSWNVITGLPSQATHSGKYLTTNGTTASWASVSTGSNWTNGTNFSYYTDSGDDLGIGYTTDQGNYKLQVNGAIKASDIITGLVLYSDTWLSSGYGVTATEIAAKPSIPASGTGQFYVRTDSKPYFQDDSGVEYALGHWLTNANGINYNSSVGIGGTPINSGYKLTVNGLTYLEGTLNMSDNAITYVTNMSFMELGSMSTPSSGYGVWWAGTDNSPHFTNDAGTQFDLSNVVEPFRSISANTTLSTTDKIVLVTTGAITITYPTITAGKVYTIRNTAATAITVPSYTKVGSSIISTSIAGLACCTLVYSGTAWFQIN